MLLTWLLLAIVVVILMTPSLLQKLFHIDTTTTLYANSATTLGLIAGCILAGVISDRLGVRSVLAIGSIALAAAYTLLVSRHRGTPGATGTAVCAYGAAG